MFKHLIIGTALATLLSGQYSSPPGQSIRSAKIAPDVEAEASDELVDVIVQFRSYPTKAHHAKVEAKGGALKTDLSGAIHGAHYSIPASRLETLAQDDEIVHISPDRRVSLMLDYANPTVGANIARANGWTGTGVGIAIVDSGVTNQPDLMGGSSSRIVYSQSFVPGVPSTLDQYGHGTHVAGILAGNSTQSTGSSYFKSFWGMAPNAKLINLRALDANGNGQDSYVINAIQAAINLKQKYNIRVLNLSLGRPVYESYKLDPLCQAVEAAWNAGIVVVVAAGNQGRDNSQGTGGYATVQAPGNDPLVITVGAMNDKATTSRGDDVMASYSSRGPSLIDHIVKPDLVAPGNRVISLTASGGTLWQNFSNPTNRILLTYYQTTTSPAYSSVYYKLSGTSMAAPMVAGTAALMIQKDPTLSPDGVKARLMKTATKAFPVSTTVTDTSTGQDFVVQYDLFTVGAGYLDSWAALNSTETVSGVGAAASPTATYNASTGQVTVQSTGAWATRSIWGTGSIWVTSAVWGPTVFVDGTRSIWGTSAVWGTRSIWGTSGTTGFSGVWGTRSIWGTTTNNTGEAANLAINGEN